MNLQLDEPIFRWLLSLGLCNSSDGKKLKNSRYQLSGFLTTAIETGPLVLKLLQIVLKKVTNNNPNKTPIIPMNNVKNVSSPTSRFYNWNLISETLKGYGFTVDKETLGLIVMGDLPMINEFLIELYQFARNSLKIAVSANVSVSYENSVSKIADSSKIVKSLPAETKESIELLGLSIDKPLTEANSLMEYLVLNLAKSLNIKPNQAATLLTKNTKYLANVLAKGSKDEFEPVVHFFQGFVENSDVILGLIQQQDSLNSLPFFLQAIKAGLVSKNADVSLWTLKTYLIFSEILEKQTSILSIFYAWLTDGLGLRNLFLCLRRHPELQDPIILVLMTFGRHSLSEILNSKLVNVFPQRKELLFVLSRIISSFAAEKTGNKKRVLDSATIGNWIGIAQEEINGEFNQEMIGHRVQGFSLLAEIWKLFPEDFEPKIADFMNSIRKNFAFPSRLLVKFLIIELFALLDYFLTKSGESSQSVNTIYSSLIASLVENFSNNEIRELLVHEFIEEFRTGKLSQFLLLESLNIHLASLDTKSFQWNVFDFELMSSIAANEKLPIKASLGILDLLAKIFFNQPIFARIASKPIIRLAANNKSIASIQDFLYKLVRTLLGIYFQLSRKQRAKDKKKQKIANSKKVLPEFSEQEEKLLKSNKTAMIIELIREILQTAEPALLGRLKNIICQTIYQMRKNISKKPNKNLMMLLQGIGEDAEKLISEYETDYFKKMASMREEEKKMLEQRELQQKSMEFDTISRISGDSNKDTVTNGLNLSLDLSNAPFKSKNPFRRNSNPVMEQSPTSKSKLGKAEELKLEMLKNAKIDPRLRRKLESLQETRKEKLKSQDQTMKDNESRLIVRKIKLRKHVEMVNMQAGIIAPSIKDRETVFMFPLDSHKDKNEENPIFLLDFNLLEDFEIRRINEVFDSDSSRIMRKCFEKYAISSKDNKVAGDFTEISNKRLIIKPSELWTLVKDLEDGEDQVFISNETLMKNLRTLLNWEKNDDNCEDVLDFKLFKKIMISVAAYIFPETEDISLKLRKLIKKIANLIGIKSLISEKEAELNEKLRENPEFPIPEGFIKVETRKTELVSRLPDELINNLGKYAIPYLVLNDLIQEKLGICLIESFGIEKPRLVVKPAKKSPKKEKPVEATETLANSENQATKDGVAPTKKEENPAKNPDEKVKKVKKPRKPHKLAKSSEKPVKTAEDLEKERKLEKERRKQERLKEKQRLESLMKERAEFEGKMRVYWEKKHQKNLSLGSPQLKPVNKTAEELKEAELKKQEFKKFNKKRLEMMKKEFQSLFSEKKKEKSVLETRSQIFVEQVQKFNEKFLPKTLEEARQRKAEKEENEELLAQRLKEERIQTFFKEYEGTLTAIFSFLLHQTYTPLNFDIERTTVPLTTLMTFANEFNVCPVLFKVKHIINFYKAITKTKPYTIDKLEVGLDFEEFKQLFFRIGVKANEFLNKIAEFLVLGGFLKGEEKGLEEQKEKGEEKKGEKKNEKKAKTSRNKEIIERNKGLISEKYVNVTLTSYQTLVGLLYHLGFPVDPKDKEGVQQRFRDVISERKTKPTKYRFLEFQKKLEGEGFEPKPEKKAKKKEGKVKKPIENENEEQNDQKIKENLEGPNQINPIENRIEGPNQEK